MHAPSAAKPTFTQRLNHSVCNECGSRPHGARGAGVTTRLIVVLVGILVVDIVVPQFIGRLVARDHVQPVPQLPPKKQNRQLSRRARPRSQATTIARRRSRDGRAGNGGKVQRAGN